MAIMGFGAISTVSCMNQHATQIAEQERVEAEQKKLARQTVQPDKLGIGATPFSTPKSDWKQGAIPHLYQTDPAWADRPYAGGTMRANACGPTSLSMVYVYLTGRTDMDPVAMAAFADQNNFAPTGATEWAFMTQGASMLGLSSENIHATREDVTNALANGMPVICSVAPGDFTTTGHYIVLGSIDARGMVEVFDPNSPYNSAKRWEIQRILSQTTACWAFWV